MRFRSLLLLVAWLVAAPASAQLARVEGMVTDIETGEPLPGATVQLEGDGETRRMASDGGGRFAFDRLGPGRYVVTASFVGYDPARDEAEVGFGETAEVRLALARDETTLDDLMVEADAAPTVGTAGLVRIRPADLALVPSLDPSGGDLAGLLGVLPGFTALGDRGGELYVRGGTPTQNLVLVDGMALFQPFHIVGFYSAVPAGIVRTADVYAGGFGARYGGRLSSVVDVTTIPGSSSRWTTSAALAPFLASISADGPLVPGRVSAVVSVRESLVEQLAAEMVGRPMPYRFGDAFGKLHARLDPRSSFTVSALTTHDRGDLLAGRNEPGAPGGASSETAWRNHAARARFFFLPEAFPAALDLSVDAARYDATLTPPEGPGREALVDRFGGEFAIQYFFGEARLRVGFGAHTYRFAYRFDATERLTRTSATEGTAYLDGEFALAPSLRIEPGFRLQTFPAQAQTISLEPRLRAAWTASARHTLSAAGGIYRQELVGLTDVEDVGDVFTAWAPVPRGRPVPTAYHALLGWEARWDRLTTNVEGYAKHLTGAATRLGPDALVSTDGRVIGLDVTAERRGAGLALLLTYGVSAVTYGTGASAFRPPHDRRHRLAAVARLERGPWALALRGQLAAGRPFSRVVGYYDALGGVNPQGGFLRDPGTLTFISEGTPYAALTPAYHRLDATVERAVPLRFGTLTLQAAVVNATDRANFFFYDVRSGRRVDQLPLLPSVGLRLDVNR